MTRYEPVIGLEVHAQLLTATKLFCGCSTAFGRSPNTNVCPVCLGMPGSLPVLNARAVLLAMRAALALGCTVHERSVFARKQYFYPDLPKGYQISQYEQPLATGGKLEIEVDGVVRVIGITRVHMEEDAGKNLHGVGGDSIVDLNRAGTPLVEIVSEPDLRSAAEAAAYLKALREVLLFAAVNDGNLEEGSFRCDANVSVRPVGATRLGTRTELKNLNSFRFVQRAIETEIARQSALLDSGGRVTQETRSYDPGTNTTATLRSKEEAHDYRYFPEPDLPPLVVDAAFAEEARAGTPMLPVVVRERWTRELGVPAQTAATLSGHPGVARFFEETLAAGADAVRAANWIQTEVLRNAKTHGLDAEFTVTPGQVAELLALVERGDISGKQAKEVHLALEGTGRTAASIVAERGLRVVSDEGALTALCEAVLAANGKQVAAYRAGKTGMLGFFVGQLMKQTGGSADPQLVTRVLERLLSAPSDAS